MTARRLISELLELKNLDIEVKVAVKDNETADWTYADVDLVGVEDECYVSILCVEEE